jgi:Flp pilus assembly protein CpaB
VFGTVLTQITGYFDRRVLISSFFPSLVFLALAALAIAVPRRGLDQLMTSWGELSGGVQALVVVGALVFVAFWTFALVNVRNVIERLYQGYWPEGRVAQRLDRSCRRAMEHTRRRLFERDRALEEEAALLREEIATYPVSAEDVGQAPGGDGVDLGVLLDDLERQHAALTGPNATVESARGAARRVRSAWHVMSADAARDAVAERLTRITADLLMALQRLARRREEQRLALYQRLSLSFPPETESVRPTSLGNVLRSAERYPWQRYRLDAVVVWSRLQSLLPSEFADLLQKSKTSFDLALTLATYTWAIGVPAAVWFTVRSGWIAGGGWAIALSALAGVCFGAVIARAHAFPAVRVLGSAVGVASIATLAAVLWPDLPGAEGIRRSGGVLLITALVVLLGYGLYRNAVRAAIGYGEVLRAAFDLHRWRVLDALHLRTPPDLAEERVMWEQLSRALYRGSTPDPAYHQYVSDDKTKPAAAPRHWVCAPVRALGRYHLLTPDDVHLVTVEGPLPVNAVTATRQVSGCLTITPLSADQPVPANVLVPAARLSGCVALPVAVPGATAQLQGLQLGDRVDVFTVRSAPGGPEVQRIAEDVLVLDVTETATEPAQVLLALPKDQQEALLIATSEGVIRLSRSLLAADASG